MKNRNSSFNVWNLSNHLEEGIGLEVSYIVSDGDVEIDEIYIIIDEDGEEIEPNISKLQNKINSNDFEFISDLQAEAWDHYMNILFKFIFYWRTLKF